MLPLEKEVGSEIATKHERVLREMNALHNLFIKMLTPRRAKWEVARRGLDPLVLVTIAGLAMKAAKTFRSVQILLERGLVDDAKALVRVLFETTVTALFILQRKSRERTRQYHAYDARNTMKMLEHWKRTPGLKRKVTKAVLAQANELVTTTAKGLPSGVDIKKHWSGLGSLENVAKAIGLEGMYATLYRFMSTSAHATDVGAHVDAVTKPGELQFNLLPTTNDVDHVALVAREVLWILSSRINNRFALGFELRLVAHKITASDLQP